MPRARTCSRSSTTSSILPRSNRVPSRSISSSSRFPSCPTMSSAHSARSRTTRGWSLTSGSPPGCPRAFKPTASGCSRSSRTCCPTRSSSPSAARCRCRSRRRHQAGLRDILNSLRRTYKPAGEERMRQATPAPQPAPTPAERDHRLLKAGPPSGSQPAVRDDRNKIRAGDRVVLIVEDDLKFASALLDLARDSGFKGVVASNAGSALPLVKELMPDAITLDLLLPDMDGWAVLDLLKHDPETRHIPVNVISVSARMNRCMQMGALGVVQKPAAKEALQEALARTRKFVDRDVKTLLVAYGDAAQRESISDALRNDGIEITGVGSGKEALEAAQRSPFDCIVVDRTLRDMSAMDFLKNFAKTQRAAKIPIVMYGTDGQGGNEQDKLRKLAEGVIVRNVSTPEAVLEQTTLFLHQVVERLPGNTRELLAQQRRLPQELSGKKALIVDDDIRNIFALTSVLEHHGMIALNAENGKDGIETLKNTPDIDVVLMDIMMPELDGYDTIRIMRKAEEFKELPIIAITARAMVGDREKCIEAGASDYLAKPVNTEQLLSLLRVWLTH